MFSYNQRSSSETDDAVGGDSNRTSRLHNRRFKFLQRARNGLDEIRSGKSVELCEKWSAFANRSSKLDALHSASGSRWAAPPMISRCVFCGIRVSTISDIGPLAFRTFPHSGHLALSVQRDFPLRKSCRLAGLQFGPPCGPLRTDVK